MDRLLNVTAIMCVVLLVTVLISLRRAHIRVEYSVSWLLAAVAMLLLSRTRPVLDVAARLLGSPTSAFALLLIAGGLALVMLFRFSVILSHLRDDNIALAQRVAILEYHIRSLGSHEEK
ncbi:MAG TPA: DUF2304 family protein [Bryobacteraceae bacterium]|nr:DUF2304 family protein [Bryobacteraceae bacterium]